MGTYTWSAGTTADWNVLSDWTPAPASPPGTAPDTDTVEFDQASNGGQAYTVLLSAGEAFDVATVILRSATDVPSPPSLTIGGQLRTDTLDFAPSVFATPVTINPGGVLDIRSAVTDSGGLAETIAIDGTGGGGTAAEGRLQFGSATSSGLGVDNPNVTYSFHNNDGGLNHGVVEYLSGYNPATPAPQHIDNFAWGDRIVFDGANFTGASFVYSNGTLDVSRSGAALLTMTNLTGPGLTSASFVGTGNAITVLCYAAGTRLSTPDGERAIETLRPGDPVLARSGAEGDWTARPVKWIGRRRIDLRAHPRPELAAPVRVRRDAVAKGVPHADLLVSPDHALLIDGTLVCARRLINGGTVRQEPERAFVEYHHVELEGHALLLAEGLPAESYLDTGNRGFFDRPGQPPALHPGAAGEAAQAARERASCIPFASDETSARAVWERLAARAAALGQPFLAPDAIADPGLRVIVDGRTFRSLGGGNGAYVFALPRGGRKARLLSRAAPPTRTRPWAEDRRCLGVYVERLTARLGGEAWEIPVDHPDVAEGWWAVERGDSGPRRWTNGDAAVPLPARDGPLLLEIRIAVGTMAYAVEDARDMGRAA